jgi:hypothetical protein
MQVVVEEPVPGTSGHCNFYIGFSSYPPHEPITVMKWLDVNGHRTRPGAEANPAHFLKQINFCMRHGFVSPADVLDEVAEVLKGGTP